ncbi:MAG TPA: alpha-1,4-glucan--maltose-1-phosphate maltosyltransferase [Solirubrobacteraceae bacterium]|nr:alpha-1,4-glucan--maltose-1-phosphate maltosyltransferase [Solirubrobacteraceae bacterium]
MPSPTRHEPPPPRIQIVAPAPMIDCGRYPCKRTIGESVAVSADIFADGHDVLRAVVKSCPPDGEGWQESAMVRTDAHVDGDRWAGEFDVTELGRWSWTIEAWADPFASWRDELQRKIDAGQEDLSGELSEGVVLLEQACERAEGADRKLVTQALTRLRDDGIPAESRHETALDPELFDAVTRHPDRSRSTVMEERLHVDVDPERARFATWYELFPRSWGGLKGVETQIPELADLGFDVLYLPPVHPIGRTNRKGANNSLTAGPGDPGSPWAIGDATGGHEGLHADLGTMDDFDALVATANKHGIQIALDFAIQASADHPWLTEHPEWFNRRPDGTLKYAENPPKKYQDIYNVNWDSEDWRGLWEALRDVVYFWAEHGVNIFRVDNPHTKPVAFWEWLIAELRREYPEIIFLAEAFTRAAMMRQLAKVGFNQSYTYFTWKSSKWELADYVTELATSGMQEYYRPNFFVNTPDILTEELQQGGPPKFASRLVLAATLSPTYGVYSGFESFERVPARPGSEEYLDSEKYEIKQRSLTGPLLTLISRMNDIRRENPAFQVLDNIQFLTTENDALIAYAKRTEENTVITVVTLDPVNAQEGIVVVPYGLGLPPVFTVTDLLSGESFDWRMGRNFVRLDPYRVAHLLRVT